MTHSSESFLRTILPDEGLLCATVIAASGRAVNRFFPTVQALSEFIGQQDIAGQAVYHACASYRPGGKRTQAAVLALKALWADVDVGADKPYASTSDALRALAAFLHTTRMPKPTVVSSGYGLHLYWPLTETVLPERWLPAAAGLKRAFTEAGFAVGKERTADSASILRPPGTFNRKHGGSRPVALLLTGAPHALSDLPCAAPANDRRPQRGADAAAALLRAAQGDHPPRTARPAMSACAQLRRFVFQKGVLPEPVWYAVLGVLAHTEDGEAIAHAVSRGDPRYSESETQGKLDRQKQLGPTTCARFHDLAPETCLGCRHAGKIVSPISLAPPVDRVSPASPVLPEEPEARLPAGFARKGSELYFLSENGKGVPVNMPVAGDHIDLVGIHAGEGGSATEHCYTFTMKMPKNPEKQFSVPLQVFYGASGQSTMRASGLDLHDWDLFREYVKGKTTMLKQERAVGTIYEQMGWKEDGSFLVGDFLFTPAGVERVPVGKTLSERAEGFGARGGSLEAWTGNANLAFVAGFEFQAVAVMTAFAAPLMHLAAPAEGGVLIHLVSDGGKGKSTALEIAESVWANDRRAVRITPRATANARTRLYGAMGNVLVTTDDFINSDPDTTRDAVMDFAQGSEKERLRSDATLNPQQGRWSTLLLSTGNSSIVEYAAASTSQNAPATRVLEFQASLPAGTAQIGDEFKRGIWDNGGWAGEAYLRYLVQPETRAWATATVRRLTEEIRIKCRLESHHIRWCRAVACLIAAAEIVSRLRLIDFSPQRFRDWLLEDLRGRVGKQEEEAPTAANPDLVVSAYLNENIHGILRCARTYLPGQSQIPLDPQPRADSLVARINRDTGVILLLKSPFRHWLRQNGIPYAQWWTAARAQGIVGQTDVVVTMGAGTNYAAGQQRCLHIELRDSATLALEDRMIIGGNVMPMRRPGKP